MSIRTDLALESINAAKISEGITKTERGKAFKITEINIAEDKHGEKIGKKKGKYITLEGSVFSCFSKDFREMCEEFSEELSQFVPDGKVLVVGLGNNDITPERIRSANSFKDTCHTSSQGRTERRGRFSYQSAPCWRTCKRSFRTNRYRNCRTDRRSDGKNRSTGNYRS